MRGYIDEKFPKNLKVVKIYSKLIVYVRIPRLGFVIFIHLCKFFEFFTFQQEDKISVGKLKEGVPLLMVVEHK